MGVKPTNIYNKVIATTILMLALLHRYAVVTETEIPVSMVERQRILVSLAYPTTQLFPKATPETLTESIVNNSKIWRGTNDVKEYIRINFGVKAVRKDMVKTLTALENPLSLQVLTMFKGTVPADWIIMLMRNPENYGLMKMEMKNVWHYGNQAGQATQHKQTIRWFFKLLNQFQAKKLFRTPDLVDYHIFKDTLSLLEKVGKENLLEELDGLDLNSWRKLHDSLSVLQRKLEHKPKPVPQDGLTGVIDGAQLKVEEETFEVRSPKMTDELLNWGYQMSNCIASYADRVARGHTKVFAVYNQQGTLIANMEYDRNRIVQFVEKHNRPVKQEMRDAMEVLINQKTSSPLGEPVNTGRAETLRRRQHEQNNDDFGYYGPALGF